MKVRRPMVGVAVYHATDLLDNAALIRDLLAAGTTAAGRSSLNYLHAQFWGSDRFARQQKVTETALAQLEVDVSGRVFRSIQFDELRKGEQEASSGYASLHIELKPATNPRIGSNSVAANPFRVYMLAPRDAVELTALLAGLNELTEAVHSPYAFVYPGEDFRDALMEVLATPMFPWGHVLSPKEEQRHHRLSRCQSDRTQVGAGVCGAHWGMVLGSTLVGALGGEERVREEAPVWGVHSLSGGRLFIQLTEELPQWSDDLDETLLQALEEFLAPVALWLDGTRQ